MHNSKHLLIYLCIHALDQLISWGLQEVLPSAALFLFLFIVTDVIIYL